MERIIEAYVGEYASGKSENAVNRAVCLQARGLPVVLADLDTVEPCYTLRPLKAKLEAMGIAVIAWETDQTFGLGEAGAALPPAARWVLRRPENIILDVGYGVHGADVFHLVEGAWENPQLQIIAVVNAMRPLTADANQIAAYVRSLGRVDALLNNTHLAEATTTDIVYQSAQIVAAAARMLKLPVVATAVDERLADAVGPDDGAGRPIRVLKRFMPDAFW